MLLIYNALWAAILNMHNSLPFVSAVSILDVFVAYSTITFLYGRSWKCIIAMLQILL